MELEKFNHINNKDILIVTLLEYICTPSNTELFKQICSYLLKNNVIDANAINSTETRELYIQTLKTLIAKYTRTEIEYNKLFASRFAIDFDTPAKITSGGFGTVYKVRNKLDEFMYAVKKVPLHDLDENMVSFEEVKYLAKLSHDNIVRYHTTWIEMGSYVDCDSESSNSSDIVACNSIIPILHIQMELCDMSLRDYLDNRQVLVDERDKKIQILKALVYIHGLGIIHKDINPNNILLKQDIIKLGDFGLAANPNVGEFGMRLYKPDDKEYSVKYDMYGTGVVFYELDHVFGTVSERYDALGRIEKSGMTSVDPAMRPDALDVLRTLQLVI